MPQVCNDLRTEYLEDPIDIYYAWSLHAPHPTSSVTTRPTKLTSWRPSSAYKEIPVPRPSQHNSHNIVNDPNFGPSWRLVLTCGTTPDDQTVVLGELDTTGNMPLAVISMPERIARSYALRVPLQDRPITFEITEQTSFDLDKKIWDSGIGLSSWLAQLYTGKGAEPGGTLSELRDALFGTDTRHILELGAGTGIVAITLAILRSTLNLSDQPGSIVTTDLPSAMPILQENIASNSTWMSNCTPQAAILDWEHQELPPVVQSQLEAGLDVIIMADVAYNTASFPALIQTLSRLIWLCKHNRNGRAPNVLMGYKERHPDERSLWNCAKDIDLHFQQIAQVNGAGGNPVEIWLGRSEYEVGRVIGMSVYDTH